MTTHYIGIGHDDISTWYTLCLFLGSSMLKIRLWTRRTMRPVCYYYKQVEFEYCLKQEITSIKWFIGLTYLTKTKSS